MGVQSQYNASFCGTLAPDEHAGVRCDGCSGPIRGIRNKCSFCPDYDLCTQCKQNGIHNHHMMHQIHPQQSPPTQHPNTTTQYPAYPQTPTQYPAYPQTPTQYPAYPQTPTQYPAYPQTPTQYPAYPQTPTQYPGYPQTPSQYPANPQTPPQYPAYPQTPTQYPAYPHTNQGSSQPIQSPQPPQTGPQTVQTVSQPIQSSPSSIPHQTHHHPPGPPFPHGHHLPGPPLHHGHRRHGPPFRRGHHPHGTPFHPGPHPPAPPFQPGYNPSGSPFPSMGVNQVQSLMQQMVLTGGMHSLPAQTNTTSSGSFSSSQDLTTAKWTPPQTGIPFRRHQLQSSDPEYQAVIQNMAQNGGSASTSKVLEINRIENYTLYNVYKSCKAEMDREYGQGFQSERNLWHGTDAAVLGNIYRGGFNRSYCGKHGTAIGDGVYFATAFSYSASPAYSPPDSKSQKYIFQCRVLTGHFVQGKSGLKEPPMRTPELRYDSVADNTGTPSMFVIFKDMQVYPEYVITLKA